MARAMPYDNENKFVVPPLGGSVWYRGMDL
jgi:hypothetical protein